MVKIITQLVLITGVGRLKVSKYIVERQLFGVDNWQNWEDENPTIYTSFKDAIEDIEEFIEDCNNGFIEQVPSITDFRIRKIN